jgi:hypothetical protein
MQHLKCGDMGINIGYSESNGQLLNSNVIPLTHMQIPYYEGNGILCNECTEGTSAAAT